MKSGSVYVLRMHIVLIVNFTSVVRRFVTDGEGVEGDLVGVEDKTFYEYHNIIT